MKNIKTNYLTKRIEFTNGGNINMIHFISAVHKAFGMDINQIAEFLAAIQMRLIAFEERFFVFGRKINLWRISI